MASPVHSVLVELLEAHPEALTYLLELQGHAPPGPLVPTTGTLTKTLMLERRVDRAYLVGSREAPSGFVLAEVQLDADDDKRFAWALYVELARTRYRCEGALVVLTFSEAVRRWIDRDITAPTGQHGSSRRLQPNVLAVDAVDPALLLRPDRPYLATLAMAAHTNEPATEAIAEAAVDLTLRHLPKRLAAEQLDAILGMLDEALRTHLESRIMEHHRPRSELFQGYYDKGWAEGVAEGRAEGAAKGVARGAAKGEVKAKAESILTVLAAREIPVSETVRQRILRCSDAALLDVWLRRAAVASTAAAVVRSKAPAAAPAGRRTARTRKTHR